MIPWISTEKRLPEKCKPVLIVFTNCCRDDLTAIAWFDRDLWWLDPKHALSRLYDKVTYWKPLPDLPKELQ